ncbi:MAG TPA: glycosyltransferase [Tepidisphaeraceae bacterium]|nr:glycosyltransferase [Tepidisphaeraceae bacterium]
MRILHVISGLDPANGGPTVALVGLAEAQARAGLAVSVLATYQNETGFPVAGRLRAAGVAVELIGPATGKLSRHPQLATAVDAAVASADVVHVHALWEDVQHRAMKSAARQRVPYVVTPHGMLSPWSFASGGLANRLGKRAYLALRLGPNLSRAAALHFTTTAERDLVARLKLNRPTIVEPVGIDLAEFADLPPPAAFRATHPELGNDPIVLFLSRLSPQKGLDVLIPAFAKIAPHTRANLVLAGPDRDGYEPTVRALVRAANLEHRVTFTGMLHGQDRIAALTAADLFVLPSHHENFGIVVAEAMAAGTPVIVSREVNAWPDVVEANAGAVIPPRDPVALAEGMTAWLHDPERRRTAGTAGRAYALAHYGWDGIARHWVDHYQALR